MAVPAVQTLAFFSRRTHWNLEIPGLIEAERPNTVDAASRSARRALLVRAVINVFANAAPVLTKPARQRIVIMGKTSVWPGRATEA
jgi:hypothetical protein